MSVPCKTLKKFEGNTLIWAATKHFIGRQTIAAAHFAKYQLAKAYPELPCGIQNIILAIVEDAFEADDAARARGDLLLPLGMDCDRAAWEAVRAHWHKPTDKEATQ